MDLTPQNIKAGKAKRRLRAFVRDVTRGSELTEEQIEALRGAHVKRLQTLPMGTKGEAEAAINVLADLAKQGWTFFLPDGEIKGTAPALKHIADVRAVRRRQLSARRHEQLRQLTHRDFIQRMEAGHAFEGRVVSIFNLMRDGRNLCEALSEAAMRTDAKPIRPYVQFITDSEKCIHTGFRLQDIWRYFRHTWASAYESVPGRSFLILVRDAAAPFHPVMGIAALASAASVLPARDDKFIGWTGDAFLRDCIAQPRNEVAVWAKETIQRAMKDIYRTDLIAQCILPARPSQRDIPRIADSLRSYAKAAKQRHVKQSDTREHKSNALRPNDDDWEAQARLDLFRSKRAMELAMLLELQSIVAVAYRGKRGRERLRALCSSDRGRDALKKIVRIARSRSIGTAIADLTVCGAIAPYNEILGGKLVAMLATSPEVIKQYAIRYARTPSVIASSMAGKAIRRPAHLVYVGTTSLYGTRPSQYDRIRIPADRIGGKSGQYISYVYLGDTAGLGTVQFGYATKQSLDVLLRRANKGFRKVNNVFGEGANPKLRALRDGLAQLGFSPDLMMHGLQKSVYGVKLVENLRDYLLGIDKRPRYLFSLKGAIDSTDAIGTWWYERWVKARLARPDISERIAKHVLVRPICHGARVTLPEQVSQERC